MKYLIQEEGSANQLEVSVNRLITDGWKPLGGVNFRKDNFKNTLFCQALIKE